MLLRMAALILSACIPLTCLAQSADRPTLPAAKLDSPPALDGEILNDPVWRSVAAETQFTQNRPDEGTPVSQRTELRPGLYGGRNLRRFCMPRRGPWADHCFRCKTRFQPGRNGQRAVHPRHLPRRTERLRFWHQPGRHGIRCAAQQGPVQAARLVLPAADST